MNEPLDNNGMSIFVIYADADINKDELTVTWEMPMKDNVRWKNKIELHTLRLQPHKKQKSEKCWKEMC